MNLTEKDLDYDLTHKHAGNGYAIIEMLDDNYCRVVSIPFATASLQAFLAWGNVLKRTMCRTDPMDENSPMVERVVPPDIANKLFTLRNQIKTGEKKVVGSWVR